MSRSDPEGLPRRGPRPFGRALFGSGLALLAGMASARADWRFCLAADRAGHKVYITAPFASSVPGEVLAADLGDDLRRRRIPHDTVQCPRAGDDIEAIAMRSHAQSFNQSFGRKPLELDWRPPGAVAASP